MNTKPIFITHNKNTLLKFQETFSEHKALQLIVRKDITSKSYPLYNNILLVETYEKDDDIEFLNALKKHTTSNIVLIVQDINKHSLMLLKKTPFAKGIVTRESILNDILKLVKNIKETDPPSTWSFITSEPVKNYHEINKKNIKNLVTKLEREASAVQASKDFIANICIAVEEVSQNAIDVIDGKEKYQASNIGWCINKDLITVVIQDFAGKLERPSFIDSILRCFTSGGAMVDKRGDTNAGIGIFMTVNIAKQIFIQVEKNKLTRICLVFPVFKRLKEYQSYGKAIFFETKEDTI